MKEEPLHIVDTSTYLFAAFLMLPQSIVLPKGGGPANALYGIVSRLAKVVRERRVKRLVAVLDDVAADEERIALSPAYKAARREFPAGLEKQMELVPEVLGAAGYATALVPGWEADDVIATIARKSREAGVPVVIVGSDKDLLQALAPGDAAYDLARDRFLPFAETNVVLGVPPERTPDFLALAGDSVDEIEGVPGIGKKTAATLINALGPIDAIYRDLDRVLAIPGLRGAKSIHAKLAAHEADARRALTLATLKTNAPVAFDLASYEVKGTTEAGRKTLREKFGFENLSERLPRAD